MQRDTRLHPVKISNHPSPDADELLMRRVARRDRVAQRELAKRLVPRVRRLCRGLVRDLQEADDASQQALVEILQSAGNFRAPGNLNAWADTITARTTLRMSRRLRMNQSFIQLVAQPERLIALVGDLRRKNVTVDQLQAYLDRLPRVKRETFVLKHGLDHTVEEIAELTQSPAGTVKDRLVSARKALRKMISRDFQVARRLRS